MRPIRLGHTLPYFLSVRVSRLIVELGRDDENYVINH